MTAIPPPRRAGFTLIELLVVIAIIGVLVGLLLPAVNSAREAARRTQCVNNLFQIGAALQNYEAVHQVLPPGVVNPIGPIQNVEKGYHVSWMVQILPFIEQKNAYNKINFDDGAYAAANDTVRRHSIHTYLCLSHSNTITDLPFRKTDYAACHHDVEAPIDVANNGVFYLNSKVRLDDVTDGTSCTIFVAEKKTLVAPILGWTSGTNATLRNAGTRINGLGASLTPLDDDDPVDPAGAPSANLFVGGFGSFHNGGANFALGDGSVKFLSNTTSPLILRRLANRADGELVSAGGF